MAGRAAPGFLIILKVDLVMERFKKESIVAKEFPKTDQYNGKAKLKGRSMSNIFFSRKALDFPASMESSFSQHRSGRALGQWRASLIVGMVFTLILGGADILIAEGVASEIWRIRVTLLVVLGAVLAMSYLRSASLFYHFSVFSACTAVSIGYGGMAIIAPEPIKWAYYFSGSLCLLWWLVASKASSGWVWSVLCVNFVIANLIWGRYDQLTAEAIVYMNVCLLLVMAAVAISVAFQEYEDRENFLVQQKQNFMKFDRSELEESESRLRFLVVLDSLTGLANKRSFERGVKMEWNRSSRSRCPLGLLRIQIDQFDHLDQNGGTEAVEVVCMQMADVSRGYTRRAGDLAAYYQSGQFALMLPDTDLNASYQVANKIKDTVKEMALPYAVDGDNKITVSVGVTAMVPRPQFLYDEIIGTAEEALRRAQSLGNEQIICL